MNKEKLEAVKKTMIDKIEKLDENDLLVFIYSSQSKNDACQTFLGTSYAIYGCLLSWAKQIQNHIISKQKEILE
jgi:hypothetical protein